MKPTQPPGPGPRSRAKLTLIRFPFDANFSFLRGAAGAPPSIRQALASESSNPWSESEIDLSEPGVLTDAGDVAAEDAVGMVSAIEAEISSSLRARSSPDRAR